MNRNELTQLGIDHELDATRRVLERIPEDQLGWRPHQKSTPLGELGAHLADIIGWQVAVLAQDELDFAGAPPPRADGSSVGALLDSFDANAAALRSAVERVDLDTLSDDWTLRVGERVVFTRPRGAVFRSFGLGHLAHHRGQMTVYLRLLDVPLPSIFGPTADEPGT